MVRMNPSYKQLFRQQNDNVIKLKWYKWRKVNRLNYMTFKFHQRIIVAAIKT